jgi:hypothetical protein
VSALLTVRSVRDGMYLDALAQEAWPWIGTSIERLSDYMLRGPISLASWLPTCGPTTNI